MQFPRLVYKGAATYLLVSDDAEYMAAIENGWNHFADDGFPIVREPAPTAQLDPAEQRRPRGRPRKVQA